MKIQGFKKIVKEDFPKDEQDLVEKLGTVFNTFQEQVYQAFNNNIDIADNLNAQYVIFKTKVNAIGVPTGNSQIKYTLKTRPKGTQVIRATNLTDKGLLTGAPFADISLSGDVITVNQITGLLANKEYEIVIIIYG